MRTSELRWRPVPMTRRRRRRAERFRLVDEPPFVTQNPAEEKAALAARILANDTPSGRRRNLYELEGEAPPDLPADRMGERFSLMTLVTTKGNLKYNPAFGSKYDVRSQERGYKWAFWKVQPRAEALDIPAACVVKLDKACYTCGSACSGRVRV